MLILIVGELLLQQLLLEDIKPGFTCNSRASSAVNVIEIGVPLPDVKNLSV